MTPTEQATHDGLIRLRASTRKLAALVDDMETMRANDGMNAVAVLADAIREEACYAAWVARKLAAKAAKVAS